MWVPNLLMHNDYLQGFHDPNKGYMGIKVFIKCKQWAPRTSSGTYQVCGLHDPIQSCPLQQMTTEWVICTTVCYKTHTISEWAPKTRLPQQGLVQSINHQSYHPTGNCMWVKGDQNHSKIVWVSMIKSYMFIKLVHCRVPWWHQWQPERPLQVLRWHQWQLNQHKGYSYIKTKSRSKL